jgi:hypothetical protein
VEAGVHILLAFYFAFQIFKEVSLDLVLRENLLSPLFGQVFVEKTKKWVLPFQGDFYMLVSIEDKHVISVTLSKQIEVWRLKAL